MRRVTPDILGEVLAATVEEVRGALVWAPVERIYDNPFQPRTQYDEVETLAESIWALRQELPATMGLQQPPVARVVRFTVDGDLLPVERAAYANPAAVQRLVTAEQHRVELHFGHRRLRAWKLLRERDAAYAQFPLMLAYADDLAMWRHVVAENAQRKDINAIEEAYTLSLAIERFGLSQEQAGEPFGYARSTVANKLRLLSLPEALRQKLADGSLSERHARAILRLAPAPHLYDSITKHDVTVSELEEQISNLIGLCKPLPPQPGTGYRVTTQRFLAGVPMYQSDNGKFDPPAWPYDWTPAATQHQGVKIQGACSTCKFRVTFGGDAGARCAYVGSACYDAKTQQWLDEQRQQQTEALKRAPVVAYSSKPSVSQETPTAASVESVSQETPTAPAVDVQVAANRAVDTLGDMNWFSTEGWSNAPAALLEKGLCSTERCPCMVVAFNPRVQPHHVRPDAEHAPNMCVGCTSSARLNNRRKEMEHGDLAERRKRIRAEQELAERLLSEAFESYRGEELWHNRIIISQIVQNELTIEQRYKLRDADMATLQWTIWEGAARTKCLEWDGSVQRWNVDRVRAWLRDVEYAAGRIEEPLTEAINKLANQDPPAAHWEDAWSADDEAAWLDLVTDWDGRSWQSLIARATRLVEETPLCITPAVLQRLGHECPVSALRLQCAALVKQWKPHECAV